MGPKVKDKHALDELRGKLKVFEHFGYKASATEVRRKIRALERGQDPDAPRIDFADHRPRKRIVWSGPLPHGRYRVRLTCRHLATVKALACGRAPLTAICPVCTPP